jgi:hypothetical protein
VLLLSISLGHTLKQVLILEVKISPMPMTLPCVWMLHKFALLKMQPLFAMLVAIGFSGSYVGFDHKHVNPANDQLMRATE